MVEKKRLFRKDDHSLVKLDKIQKYVEFGKKDKLHTVKMRDVIDILISLRKLYYSEKDPPSKYQTHDLLLCAKELKYYSEVLEKPILTREEIMEAREKFYPFFLSEINKPIMKDTLEAAKPVQDSQE